jgi:hypothetical protein
MTIGGGHIWVFNFHSTFNSSYGSITELNESNGSLVRVINGLPDKFDGPNAIAVSGGHVWVSNNGSPFPLPGGGVSKGSITELNESDGSLIRVINAKADEIRSPSGIVFNSGHLWIANSGGTTNTNGSITEIDASDDSLIQVIKAKVDGFRMALDISSSAGRLWIANLGTVTELNSSNGALVKLIQTNSLLGIFAVNSNFIWSVNPLQNSVTEFDTSNGKFVRTIDARQGSLDHPLGIAVSGKHLWVISGSSKGKSGSVSELKTSNGSLVRVIK